MSGSYEVVVVGAGFAGLYMLHRLRQLGLSVRLFEAGDGVGGTWYWNRYPGARVDVESLEYCYSFSPELDAEWAWSERYATQPELKAYLNHVADRFDLRGDIQLQTRVAAAAFNSVKGLWQVTLDGGETVTARYCVMATGCLSVPNDIAFDGAETFAGASYRTSRWPEAGVDFTGQRVAVIGTGSSAVQSIPLIAEQAAHLSVLQRTPNFSAPARNGPIAPEIAADWAANRDQYRQEGRDTGAGIRGIAARDLIAADEDEATRGAEFERRWQIGGFALLGAYADLSFNPESNETAAAFVRDKIAAVVKDPATAQALMPRSFPIGTKRMCVDSGYYETFNRDNVSLVDLSATPIKAIEAGGVRTSAGLIEVDAIVYAIGFDAMTGALARIDIRGRDGVALSERWAAGPRTYLGLMSAGFPNLFLITGPGSPSVLANMAVAIEQHVDWIVDCLAWMGERQLRVIEADEAAQDSWVAHVNEVAEASLFPRAASWYMGANVPGKARVFMPYIGGLPAYRAQCEAIVAAGYQGFVLSGETRPGQAE